VHVASRSRRFSRALRQTPISSAKGALNGFARVAAALRDAPEGVFLFDCEPRRESAEPAAGAGERGAPLGERCVAADSGESVGAPGDAAAADVKKLAPGGGAPLPDEFVGILGGRQARRVDHVDVGALARSCRTLDAPNRRCAASIVVVEAERDDLDAQPVESFEGRRAERGPTQRGDVLDSACAELMYVD
jgi:hypothetical protein